MKMSRFTVRRVTAALAVLWAMTALACTHSQPLEDARTHLRGVDERFEPKDPAPEDTQPQDFADGQLRSYLLHALRHNHGLQARYEQWRAAVETIEATGQYPEPVLTYGVFLQRVETRVGAQRQRLGMRVKLPWPTRLDADIQAAAHEATAAAHRFEAALLALAHRVGKAFWTLWAIDARRAALDDQRAILVQLAASTRARLEVGRATVAELSQIELGLSRADDAIENLSADRQSTQAELLAAVGAPQGSQTPIDAAAPAPRPPGQNLQELQALARAHPDARALGALAMAQQSRAASAHAERYPDLTFGLDWIDTAAIEGADIDDNGKDPIMATISLDLPLWTDHQAHAMASSARGRALEHQQLDLAEALCAMVVQTQTHIQNTHRRLLLFETTLIPQAQTAFESSVGTYETNQSNLNATLLAFGQLAALRLEHIDLHLQHTLAWLQLQALVGRTLMTEAAP